MDELGRKVATATVNVGDKQAVHELDLINAKLAETGKRVANPRIDVAGAARVQATLSGLELGLDRLAARDATAKVSLDDTGFSAKLAAVNAALSGVNEKLGGIPSMLAKIAPAIPVLGVMSAAVGAVAVSLGGAVVGAGVFALAAKSVIANAATNLAKLQQLERAVNSARTASQKKAAEEQVTLLEKTWDKGYLDMIDSLQTFQQKWQETSQKIAVPALTTWLRTLTDGMKFLPPLVAPVAALFNSWGQTLDRYFKSHAGSDEVTRIAKAIGSFSADQLSALGVFLSDVAKGIVNLGRDLGAHGADFGAFSTYLDRWGGAFLRWSQSASARKDVSQFLAWVHNNGGTVKTVLGDLAKILPNMFVGLSGAGSLELKGIEEFLNLLTGLPSWMQQWIVEGLPLFVVGSKVLPVIAAASALVSKVTTLMGMKGPAAGVNAAENAGSSAAGAAGAGAAGGGVSGLLAGFTPAAFAAAGAAIAGGIILKVREDLKSGFKGIIKDIPGWFNFGTLGFISESAQGWADLIVSKLRHSFMSWEDDVRHFIAASWDQTRHDAASAWDGIIGFLSGSWSKLQHTAATDFDALRHSIANVWDGVRHDLASDWDSIRSGAGQWISNVGKTISNGWSSIKSGASSAWHGVASTLSNEWSSIRSGASSWISNVESTVKRGWSTVSSATSSAWNGIVSFFKGIPSKVLGAINSLISGAKTWGHNVMTNMLSGFQSVWQTIVNFFKSLPSNILHALGIHSPPSWAVDAGKWIMKGLGIGITDHLKGVVANAKQVADAVATGVSGAGPTGGDAGTNKKLMQQMAGAYGWGSGNQWASLNTLEMHEAGYNRFARNPNSGAYGIPQAYPPTKMPLSAQAAGGSHAGPQIAWMLSYIKSAYGSPANAWAKYYQHPGGVGWYAGGGATSAGWAMVGEHGRELVKVPGGATVFPNGATNSMLAGGGGGASIVQLEISGGAGEFERFMADFIKNHVRIKGGGSVQRAFGSGSN